MNTSVESITSSNPDVVTPEQYATAIKDPEHLKRWLKETQREFLILRTDHLVDALPWPGGVQTLIQMIELYKDHRATIPTGKTLTEKNTITDEIVEVQEMHPETLTEEEKGLLVKALTD